MTLELVALSMPNRDVKCIATLLDKDCNIMAVTEMTLDIRGIERGVLGSKSVNPLDDKMAANLISEPVIVELVHTDEVLNTLEVEPFEGQVTITNV